MVLIYFVYYDDRHIPRLMALIRNRQHRFMYRSSVIFARFDNTSNANETTNIVEMGDNNDDGVSVVEVDLHFATDQSIENVNRAFDNPMFDVNFSQRRDQDNDEVGIKDSVDGGGVSSQNEMKIGEANF
jgi:hypothetical protein